MKIDIAIPSYKALVAPKAKMAMDAVLAYSGCSCFQQNGELAERLYEAAATGRKLKDLPPGNPFHHPSMCPFNKHDIHVIPQIDACVIHWARNDLLSRRRLDADYVLFCDDDIVIPHDTIERLLSHKKDVIAGLCTRRVDPPEPVLRAWVEQAQDYGVIVQWPLNKLVEVDAVGTGLLMLSRQVIEDVAQHYYPRKYKETGNGWWFEFLRAPFGAEWGEDMSFCFKAARIGYRLFVDTSITPEHIGSYGFSIEDFLYYQEAVEAAGGLASYRAQQKREHVKPKRELELEAVT